jgi:hypothetical protein
MFPRRAAASSLHDQLETEHRGWRRRHPGRGGLPLDDVPGTVHPPSRIRNNQSISTPDFDKFRSVGSISARTFFLKSGRYFEIAIYINGTQN